jgi:hypothetical protein
VRGIVQRFLRRRLIRAGREINFDIFANVNAGDIVVAHVFESFFDGDALRIYNGFFRGDDDFGFHVRAGKGCGKISS